MRKAFLVDLNIKTMTIKVRHPKGEFSYGERRVVTIKPQAEEATMRFLRERQEHLHSIGIKESKYLIRNFSSGSEASFSSNHFRKLKKRLQDTTGIEFKIKFTVAHLPLYLFRRTLP